MFTYHARGCKHETDEEGKRLDAIRQVTNDTENAEFWSVYRRNSDDPDTNTKCIADFYGESMKANAKDFTHIRNHVLPSNWKPMLITRLKTYEWLEIYKIPEAGTKVGGDKRAALYLVNGNPCKSPMAVIQFVAKQFSQEDAELAKAAMQRDSKNSLADEA